MVASHHENIATFYGVCISPMEMVLVTQYCIKGSLEVSKHISVQFFLYTTTTLIDRFFQEIFLFEPVHLDETFMASLVMDIVKGMLYLHKTSHIGIHGNLKSSNCLVTGRWEVKLSNFGLVELRSKFREDRGMSQR